MLDNNDMFFSSASHMSARCPAGSYFGKASGLGGTSALSQEKRKINKLGLGYAVHRIRIDFKVYRYSVELFFGIEFWTSIE